MKRDLSSIIEQMEDISLDDKVKRRKYTEKEQEERVRKFIRGVKRKHGAQTDALCSMLRDLEVDQKTNGKRRRVSAIVKSSENPSESSEFVEICIDRKLVMKYMPLLLKGEGQKLIEYYKAPPLSVTPFTVPSQQPLRLKIKKNLFQHILNALAEPDKDRQKTDSSGNRIISPAIEELSDAEDDDLMDMQSVQGSHDIEMRC
eukprot:TRINITY_DN2925_c1_g1_i1.p1 TRINITY_DN2925_c1_g1~~TRINITY_DN2925_c1_g1_i1.p1  ORF type:complete len:213 (+),score=42.51 TRINITY_DN2925_c1_g1_i1:34-639(+)